MPGLPSIVVTPVETSDDVEITGRHWQVILYNDDYHAFDEVTLQVQKATGFNYEVAEAITYEAHTRGRAVAYTGSQESCEKVAAVLREIKLQCELIQV